MRPTQRYGAGATARHRAFRARSAFAGPAVVVTGSAVAEVAVGGRRDRTNASGRASCDGTFESQRSMRRSCRCNTPLDPMLTARRSSWLFRVPAGSVPWAGVAEKVARKVATDRVSGCAVRVQEYSRPLVAAREQVIQSFRAVYVRLLAPGQAEKACLDCLYATVARAAERDGARRDELEPSPAVHDEYSRC